MLDIGLPQRDGFTVLRQLREARVSLRVIILTARDSVGDKVAGLEGGADDYLPKPFTFEDLLAELLLRKPGTLLSREQILSHVWGFDFDPGSNVVDVYIGHLRRKLGPDLIETVRGNGLPAAGIVASTAWPGRPPLARLDDHTAHARAFPGV